MESLIDLCQVMVWPCGWVCTDSEFVTRYDNRRENIIPRVNRNTLSLVLLGTANSRENRAI